MDNRTTRALTIHKLTRMTIKLKCTTIKIQAFLLRMTIKMKKQRIMTMRTKMRTKLLQKVAIKITPNHKAPTSQLILESLYKKILK